jgi:group I intron endonuclease
MKIALITATGIYKITSPSGKVYIGQAWNIKRRFREYTYLWKSKTQIKLHSSFKKYGINNHKFEIIHELPEDITQSVLDTYEQLYMDLYRDCNIELLNLREAGSRGKHSKESKDKLSIAHTGKIMTDETKKRISENRKGKNTGLSNSMYGIGLTGEAKERMRHSKIGTKVSEETKKKMSESAKLSHARRKKI